MRPVFEARAFDGAGRVGELDVPRADATVRTPALLPVINPNVVTVDPDRLRGEFGAQMLITNAYIVHGTDDLRDRALEEGLHAMLGFDGPVMTDSGSFQLAEYGDIDVTTREIVEFQRDIGSDVGTPVDVPTPPEADRETARRDVETTTDRLRTAAGVDVGEMLVTAPVQGGTYPELRERAGREARGSGLDVFPVGGVVPLLNAYRYAETVEAVAAARRGLGPGAPVHLFGAGHPMTFALATALGCDLFDSAAYALYARDDRYLTVRGTHHLGELTELPCSCPVCVGHDPDSLAALDEEDREERLATHNLHVSFAEMRRVRDAVRRGDLFELVEARARAHPALLDGYRALLDVDADRQAAADPVSKDTFAYCSTESARRPEVRRHHERLRRVEVPDRLLLTEGPEVGEYAASWSVRPPFGPVPPALSRSYPLTATLPDRTDRAARAAAAEAVAALVDDNPGTAFALAHRGWSPGVLDPVPDAVELVDLSGVGGPARPDADADDGDRA